MTLTSSVDVGFTVCAERGERIDVATSIPVVFRDGEFLVF